MFSLHSQWNLKSAEPSYCIEVDESGSYATIGGGDGISIYSIKGEKVKMITRLKNNSIPILDVKLSPTSLLSGNKEGHLVEWDLETEKKILKIFHSKGPLRTVERISENLIISGGNDSNVKIWDTRFSSSKCVQELRDHKDSISCIKWKPYQIISSSIDGSVKSRDIRSGLQREDIYSSPCTSLLLLPNTYCVSLLEDKIIIPPALHQQNYSLLEGHQNRKTFLKSAYLPTFNGSDLIASGSEDCSLHIWEWTGRERQTIPTEEIPTSICYNERTKSLITLSIDGLLTKFSITATATTTT